MTPQQLVQTALNIRDLASKLTGAANALYELASKVVALTDRSDPLTLPLTQVETDHYVQVFTPPYQQDLADIKVITDALGITVTPPK